MTSFPLLRLPVDVIFRTILMMHIDQVFGLSLLSKRCKNVITSLKMKALWIDITVVPCASPYIFVSVAFRTYHLHVLCWDWNPATMPDGMTKRAGALNCITVTEVTTGLPGILSYDCDGYGFEMRTLMEHLYSTFHFPCVEQITFSQRAHHYDIDSLRYAFPNVRRLKIRDSGLFRYNQLILDKFLPVDELAIEPDTFQDLKIPHHILIQNFNEITVAEESEEDLNMSLNDLLMNNSKMILLHNLQIPLKHFNKFIKLWMQGSNPQLEQLYLDYRNGGLTDVEAIMKGIKYQEVPLVRRRWFKASSSYFEEIVHGGLDIYREDGTKATVYIWSDKGIFRWEMYVWHDHCNVPPPVGRFTCSA